MCCHGGSWTQQLAAPPAAEDDTLVEIRTGAARKLRDVGPDGSTGTTALVLPTPELTKLTHLSRE